MGLLQLTPDAKLGSPAPSADLLLVNFLQEELILQCLHSLAADYIRYRSKQSGACLDETEFAYITPELKDHLVARLGVEGRHDYIALVHRGVEHLVQEGCLPDRITVPVR